MGFNGLKTQKAMSYLQIAIDYAPSRMIVIQPDVFYIIVLIYPLCFRIIQIKIIC